MMIHSKINIERISSAMRDINSGLIHESTMTEFLNHIAMQCELMWKGEDLWLSVGMYHMQNSVRLPLGLGVSYKLINPTERIASLAVALTVAAMFPAFYMSGKEDDASVESGIIMESFVTMKELPLMQLRLRKLDAMLRKINGVSGNARSTVWITEDSKRCYWCERDLLELTGDKEHFFDRS